MADEYVLRRIFEDEIKPFPQQVRQKLRRVLLDDLAMDVGDALILVRRLKEAGFLSPVQQLADVGKALAAERAPKEEGWVPPEWEGR